MSEENTEYERAHRLKRVTCRLKWGKEIRKGNEIQYEMYIKDKNVKGRAGHEVLSCHASILARGYVYSRM